MGMSNVIVRLYHMTKSEYSVLGSMRCAEAAVRSTEMTVHSTTFMFVNKGDIREYASLNEYDDAFLELAGKMARFIPDNMVLGCKTPISDCGRKVATFGDAFKVRLKSYDFASPKLARYKTAKDGELAMSCRLNQTGNIFYATDEGSKIGHDTQQLFKGTQVLLTAMTKALAQKNKTLFDYDAWEHMLAQSGNFTQVMKSEETISIKTGKATIDTQIIASLIPAFSDAAGSSSLAIAKKVLGALGGEYRAESTTSEARKAHILFYCEEIMGAPSVIVRLYHMEKSAFERIASMPCGQAATSATTMTVLNTAFMFVSPRDIKENAAGLNEDDEAFTELVGKLAAFI